MAQAQRTQAERVRETRTKLIKATVAALDAHGFAATSMSVIQAGAGVSRGALMHHFSSRNALIVATAEHLLDAALRPARSARNKGDLTLLVQYYWRRVVNTCEGRAFIEILIACRTDPDLQEALTIVFNEWEEDVSRAAVETFDGQSPEDVLLVWSIARTFLRGLIVHARFVDDPAKLEKMILRFAEMLSPSLSLKP